MNGFQTYFQGNTSRHGYAGGDGGTIRMRLVADAGGLPDESQRLAELIWHPGLVDGRTYPDDGSSSSAGHHINFAEHNWPTEPALVAGQRYHLILENIDAAPNRNWISLNSPFTPDQADRGPYAPKVSDWGMTVDWGDGAGWGETTRREKFLGGRGRYEVNLMVFMAGGEKFGNSYMQAKADYAVTGQSMVRQVFTPKSNVRVSGLSAYVAGSGTLKAVLSTDSSEIGSWTNNSGGSHRLFDTGSLTLEAGREYYLEFSAQSGSMTMGTFRDGTAGLGKNYPHGGAWNDGYSQYSTGSGWSNTFFTYSDLAGVAFGIR